MFVGVLVQSSECGPGVDLLPPNPFVTAASRSSSSSSDEKNLIPPPLGEEHEAGELLFVYRPLAEWYRGKKFFSNFFLEKKSDPMRFDFFSYFLGQTYSE